MCCHCRVTLVITWKLCDRFLATIASRLVTTTLLQVALVCCMIWPRFGIDPAEADERLVGTIRVDAVDVDLGVGVGEVAARRRDVHADLSLELLREADRVLVHERLVQIGIERELIERVGGRRRDDLLFRTRRRPARRRGRGGSGSTWSRRS